ncbi:MAG: hydrogenase [Bacteroidetes bacterium]|nr:MAG: hydrogenase [Deltaproteobacteria bacterium]RLC17036.1 MAG: hydrogenase [Deltaproteobacteria bacterium]RLD54885.1 MAG: hydrogenase [Bacteroidota bacterium]
MTQNVPAIIMGFREGLEAFLVIALILRYLTAIGNTQLKGKVYMGGVAGIFGSVLLGLGLFLVANVLGGVSTLSKAWESGASFIALILVTTFIIWMIRHGSQMTSTVCEQVSQNLSATGIFLIAFAMVMREGTEIAIFAFAGKYSTVAVFIGICMSLVLATFIYHSLIRVRIDLIFRITLVYLILQAGFLLGYSIHEGLSAMKGYALLAKDSLLLDKAYNLSNTVFNHKDGIIGLPLNVLIGWYSKPEWIQLIVQYTYTLGIFAFWISNSKKQSKQMTKKHSSSMDCKAAAIS